MNFCGLEKRNKDGNTALHLAVKSNSTSTVKEILKAAVDNFDIVLARNRLNQTVFELPECSPEIHTLLLKHYNKAKMQETRDTTVNFFNLNKTIDGVGRLSYPSEQHV